MDLISRLAPSPDPASLSRQLHRAHEAIRARSATDPGLARMSTTALVALAQSASIHLAHVGDCRAYLLRQGRLERLTRDHSMGEAMVDRGVLVQDEIGRSPYRNMLTRALGMDGDLEVDEVRVEIRPGDRVLLCSDGLHGLAPDGAIEQVLRTVRDPKRAARALVALANRAGGTDNITAVILDVGGEEAGLKRERSWIGVTDTDSR
jgi:serine/threonine protein phosphatase PrpC